ncbi:MAG: tRNA pseudouridine(13) synthase TruD [Phycisphaerales bacterium]|nr:tRNA pseudouridine(13) synthase TruD [Phycisphaerales bacterium]
MTELRPVKLEDLPDPRLLVRSTNDESLGGRFRVHNDEFLVEEISLFEPSGEGEHLYVRIQKNGVSHRDMVGRLVRAFDVPESAIGYAGMKDRRAITQQTFSIHTDKNDIPKFDEEKISVLWADRHQHKIRRGQLQGNRFSIRIRDVDPLAAPRAWKILQHLEQHGLPNAYMSQRFGYRLNNHRLGAAWLSGRWRDLLDEWLGPDGSPSPPSESQARADYAAGRFQQAIAASGREWWAERRALEALAEGASPARACSEVPSVIRQLWLDSVQATIFNHTLAARLQVGNMSQLLEGDIPWDHGRGRWFRQDEQERSAPMLAEDLAAFRISATGPLHGRRMPAPGSEVQEIEQEAARSAGMEVKLLDSDGGSRRGSRRPLRVPVSNSGMDSGTDERGGYVRLIFELPRGAYATGVLSEVMGSDAVEERGWLRS